MKCYTTLSTIHHTDNLNLHRDFKAKILLSHTAKLEILHLARRLFVGNQTPDLKRKQFVLSAKLEESYLVLVNYNSLLFDKFNRQPRRDGSNLSTIEHYSLHYRTSNIV